ncbi:MAG TPA: hypothetical protein VF290_20585 [Pyrinomonadaceae bacterium]
MIKKLSELKPYKSFLLGRIQGKPPGRGVIDALLDELSEVLSLDADENRRLVSRGDETKTGELFAGYLHYVEEQQAPWTTNPSVVDETNQLVVVCRLKRHVAVYVSDPKWRSPIVKRFDQNGGKGLGLLRKIDPGFLNAAFVKGPARTLWLSGTHARTSIKADNKILSGIELQDALDPVGDQTYYFTAARCALELDPTVLAVGTSPRGSRIWVSTSRDWNEVRKAVTAILKHLEGIRKPVRAPLPVVAVSSVDGKSVDAAFDLGVIPPELLSDDPAITTDERVEMEEWAYHATFRVLKCDGPDLRAEVVLKGTPLGTVDFAVDVRDPQQVTWEVDGTASSHKTREDLDRALSVLRRPNWVKIWYDSGHTISDGQVFELRHRDVPFTDFSWVNFKGYDVTKEKPRVLDLNMLGDDKSLFCWVKNHWPLRALGTPQGGWLACDDGAMEIADFIHLDDKSDPPKLSLIHVKASDDDTPTRGISVSKYEVVTSQAVKNLRSLDRAILEVGLRDGMDKSVGKLVWYNRREVKGGRKGMLDALDKIGAGYERQVVIIQPRLTKARTLLARSRPDSPDAARLRQLDTLLLTQANSCHGLQARLRVLCAD